MISLKRNSKGEIQLAKGKRVRQSSMYTPGQNSAFKISRSKFSDFIDCPRCFYLDRVKGLESPSVPGWSLNVAVDELLKKEFDIYRDEQKPHPIFNENNLNFVPYKHTDIDKWRDSRTGGILYEDQNSNLIIHGGVDDIWFDKDNDQLVVADYKAQSSNKDLEKDLYLSSPYHQSYKTQMEIYVHILKKMGFDVSSKTYFVVCNAQKNLERFDSVMQFEVKLIEYEVDISWVEEKIIEMKKVLDTETLPNTNPCCMNCSYLEQGNIFISSNIERANVL